MEQTYYTTILLTPAEGCFLTQADDVADENRIITEEVWLAANDSAANWREISAEEAEALRRASEAALRRRLESHIREEGAATSTKSQ